MSRPIPDYALLSDCHRAALLSRSGSVDRLCAPRFDSPPVLGRLLGEGAGHWAFVWEIRGEPRPYLHSKLMCWVALGRAIDMAGLLERDNDRLQRWREAREAIRDAIEDR